MSKKLQAKSKPRTIEQIKQQAEQQFNKKYSEDLDTIWGAVSSLSYIDKVPQPNETINQPETSNTSLKTQVFQNKVWYQYIKDNMEANKKGSRSSQTNKKEEKISSFHYATDGTEKSKINSTHKARTSIKAPQNKAKISSEDSNTKDNTSKPLRSSINASQMVKLRQSIKQTKEMKLPYNEYGIISVKVIEQDPRTIKIRQKLTKDSQESARQSSLPKNKKSTATQEQKHRKEKRQSKAGNQFDRISSIFGEVTTHRRKSATISAESEQKNPKLMDKKGSTEPKTVEGKYNKKESFSPEAEQKFDQKLRKTFSAIKAARRFSQENLSLAERTQKKLEEPTVQLKLSHDSTKEALQNLQNKRIPKKSSIVRFSSFVGAEDPNKRRSTNPHQFKPTGLTDEKRKSIVDELFDKGKLKEKTKEAPSLSSSRNNLSSINSETYSDIKPNKVLCSFKNKKQNKNINNSNITNTSERVTKRLEIRSSKSRERSCSPSRCSSSSRGREKVELEPLYTYNPKSRKESLQKNNQSPNPLNRRMDISTERLLSVQNQSHTKNLVAVQSSSPSWFNCFTSHPADDKEKTNSAKDKKKRKSSLKKKKE